MNLGQALFTAALHVAMSQACAADVAVDVGHTVLRPGSTSASGVAEFIFNHRLALAVANQLSLDGLAVHVINGDGRIRSLDQRTLQASNEPLFVSIHHDSVQPQFLPVRDARFSGFSIWVSRKTLAYAGSVRCAEILGDSLLSAGFKPSGYHADPIHGESRTPVDLARGIFLNDGLAVLNTARSPAVLIEAGVIVNPEEEARLSDAGSVRYQAQAIAAGVRRCKATLGPRFQQAAGFQ